MQVYTLLLIIGCTLAVTKSALSATCNCNCCDSGIDCRPYPYGLISVSSCTGRSCLDSCSQQHRACYNAYYNEMGRINVDCNQGGSTGSSSPVPTSPTPTRATPTARPGSTVPAKPTTCVCSCCSGVLCTPKPQYSFFDAGCTDKSCHSRCKELVKDPCDKFIGSNAAYCGY
ncbi:unnamed protein product [Didymodactylos carnosus]|uniref:Uncharacterized protein n=1 Tax=Didymodactylos carnosus TaxID=1234261 RepID=A0A813VP06_9BILA|nr:unnamed protein product [Didymodactylos carnosus]CAF3626636.1 unnamed protein product [Didymodactylos carnosus]